MLPLHHTLIGSPERNRTPIPSLTVKRSALELPENSDLKEQTVLRRSELGARGKAKQSVLRLIILLPSVTDIKHCEDIISCGDDSCQVIVSL